MDESESPDLAGRYLPYLVEIRRRFFFVFCLFLIGCIIGFIYYESVIRFILKLFKFHGVNIVFTSPFQFLELAVNSSLLIGLLIALPMIIYQVFAFIKPALRKNEFRSLLFLIPFSLILFLLGFLYGAMMMRSTLEIFYNQTQKLGLGNYLDVSHFLSTTMTTAILMGVAFQFPVVITLLLHLGLLTTKAFSKIRLFFYIGALIFCVFLPPTDLVSLFLLTIPLLVLFELTLILNKTLFRPSKR